VAADAAERSAGSGPSSLPRAGTVTARASTTVRAATVALLAGAAAAACDDEPLQIQQRWPTSGRALVGEIWRHRRSESEHALAMISQHGRHVVLCRLRSKREARDFLSALAQR
jgi:soluble lytic murein transglycosylase-like protein